MDYFKHYLPKGPSAVLFHHLKKKFKKQKNTSSGRFYRGLVQKPVINIPEE